MPRRYRRDALYTAMSPSGTCDVHWDDINPADEVRLTSTASDTETLGMFVSLLLALHDELPTASSSNVAKELAYAMTGATMRELQQLLLELPAHLRPMKHEPKDLVALSMRVGFYWLTSTAGHSH